MSNRPTAAAYQFGAALLDSLLTRRHGARRARLSVQDLSAIEPQQNQLAQFAGSYIGRDFYGEIRLENGKLGIRAAFMLRFSSALHAAAQDWNCGRLVRSDKIGCRI
jgi:hypothetical protein